MKRDIGTSKSLADKCFYSTYKELKQMKNNIMNSISQIVFIVPIRNWNQERSWWCYICDWRFYSTYKELKHLNSKRLSFLIFFVFIVPIRNWNKDISILDLEESKGFYSTYKELKLMMFSASLGSQVGFYSTYKELKQFLSFYINLKSRLFL